MIFDSLDAFAKHVIDVGIRERIADEAGRRAVAETQIQGAQSMIGKAANFAPLAPRTVAERRRLGYPPYETLLRSGDYRRSWQWASEGPRATTMGSNSKDAPYHELGGIVRGHPPKRSVLVDPTRDRDRILFMLFGKTFFLTIRA